MDTMAREQDRASDGYHAATTASARGNSPEIQQVQGAGGGKRAAPEQLEQSTSKVAKLTTSNDDEAFSEVEVKPETDERDVKIGKLMVALQNSKEKVGELQDELEQAEEERTDYRARVHILEARNEQAREKEKVVETTMTAAMKQASRKLDAQQKADHQQKLKEMKQVFKEDKEELIAQAKSKVKKVENDASVKLQREKKEWQMKYNTTVANHKEEVKKMKEQHKVELKGLRPDHSKAMKEKVSELKTKDVEISNLKTSLQSMNALEAEKEKLADELQKERTRNEHLAVNIENIKKAHAGLEGQYQHDIEQADQKWQIQNDVAENAKAQLMLQQRSNFALRAEANNKAQRIQILERQLQAAQAQPQIPTANASAQTSAGTGDSNGSEIDNLDSQTRKFESSPPAAKMAIDSTTSERVETGTGPEPVE